MPDLLVKLYELADDPARLTALAARGITVRAAAPTEGRVVARWVAQHFDESWGRAAELAALRHPSTCFVAAERDRQHVPRHAYDLPAERIVGFACYDSDVRGMFGPIGVQPDRQAQGIGTALLRRALRAMADEGYAYAIIGWAGPVEWYAREVGATVIPNSEPGPFRGPNRALGSPSRRCPGHAAEDSLVDLTLRQCTSVHTFGAWCSSGTRRRRGRICASIALISRTPSACLRTHWH